MSNASFQCSTSVMHLSCLWGCLCRCTARQFEFWSFGCLAVFYILVCFHLYTKDMIGSKVHCCSDDKQAFRALLSLNISTYAIITLILDFGLHYPKGKFFFTALYPSDGQSIWQTIYKKQYIQQHMVKTHTLPNGNYRTTLRSVQPGLWLRPIIAKGIRLFPKWALLHLSTLYFRPEGTDYYMAFEKLLSSNG